VLAPAARECAGGRAAAAAALGSVAFRVSGLLVTFEGIDRAGKTTQARLLREALGDEAVAVREPGGTEVGERVRELVKDPAVELSSQAEALLFAAARAELVARVIRPALDAGRVVVSDRFLDSSLAYQGAARGLGVEEVARVNRFATAGLIPDLTFLLVIDPGTAAERGGRLDRFEAEGEALQEAVLSAYERLAAEEPGRWVRLDAARSSAEVHANVRAAVKAARAGEASPSSTTRAPA
jgi:dTMP kinase